MWLELGNAPREEGIAGCANATELTVLVWPVSGWPSWTGLSRSAKT
jgi:hypothetical protein